jgi:hypothetical protein
MKARIKDGSGENYHSFFAFYLRELKELISREYIKSVML